MIHVIIDKIKYKIHNVENVNQWIPVNDVKINNDVHYKLPDGAVNIGQPTLIRDLRNGQYGDGEAADFYDWFIKGNAQEVTVIYSARVGVGGNAVANYDMLRVKLKDARPSRWYCEYSGGGNNGDVTYEYLELSPQDIEVQYIWNQVDD